MTGVQWLVGFVFFNVCTCCCKQPQADLKALEGRSCKLQPLLSFEQLEVSLAYSILHACSSIASPLSSL